MISAAKENPDTIGSQALQEVVVTGQSARQRISGAGLGSENLELTKLALTPQLFGEKDIIKSWNTKNNYRHYE